MIFKHINDSYKYKPKYKNENKKTIKPFNRFVLCKKVLAKFMLARDVVSCYNIRDKNHSQSHFPIIVNKIIICTCAACVNV